MERGFFRFSDFAGTLPAYPEWYPGPDYLEKRESKLVATVHPDSAFGTALLWPTEAVAPFNPIMQGWYRNREYEGVKKAGLYGWPYIQVGGAIGYIYRCEPDRACDWFYAFVNHASGTLDGVKEYLQTLIRQTLVPVDKCLTVGPQECSPPSCGTST